MGSPYYAAPVTYGMTKLDAIRPRFLKTIGEAEKAIMERRTGRFKTSDRCYIDVCFWKGRLEVEAVADNLLLKPRSRRRANLPPFAPKDRDVPVSPREREILEEYRVRGPQLVLQRLRKAMSEVLKCGLDRDDLVHLAAKARRLNINW